MHKYRGELSRATLGQIHAAEPSQSLLTTKMPTTATSASMAARWCSTCTAGENSFATPVGVGSYPSLSRAWTQAWATLSAIGVRNGFRCAMSRPFDRISADSPMHSNAHSQAHHMQCRWRRAPLACQG